MTQSYKDLKDIAEDLFLPDITFESSQQQYARWALNGNYDEMIKDENNYTAPRKLTEKLVKLFPDPETRKEATVFDLGAGSGIMAEWLLDCGFEKFHALEPLKEFLDLAKEKNIYEKLYNCSIGGDQALNIPDASYDIVIAAGSYGPGHIPADAFHEIIRILKPGGYFINGMRHSYLWTANNYKNILEPLCQKLEAEGKWKKVVWETYPNHFMEHEGLLMVFQAC